MKKLVTLALSVLVLASLWQWVVAPRVLPPLGRARADTVHKMKSGEMYLAGLIAPAFEIGGRAISAAHDPQATSTKASRATTKKVTQPKQERARRSKARRPHPVPTPGVALPTIQTPASLRADGTEAWKRQPFDQRWATYNSQAMAPVRNTTRGALAVLLAALALILYRHTPFGHAFRLARAGVMLLISLRRIKPGTTHGSARWGDRDAGLLREITVNRRKGVWLDVGTTGPWYRRRRIGVPEWRHYEHLALFSPPGAGKTSAIIAPNLLQEPGTRSIAITDSKKELIPLTAPYLRGVYGPENVWILDFLDPAISLGYNPLAYIKDATGASAWAGAWVENTGASTKDPFWGSINRQIIAAVVLHLLAVEKEHHGEGAVPPLVAVANFLAGQSPDHIKTALENSPSPEAQRVARAQFVALAKTEKLLGSVFVELAGRFECLLDPKVRQVTSRNEIDIHRIGTTPTALYLPLPIDAPTLKLLRPLVASFYSQFFTGLSGLASRSPGRHLPCPVLCYMDEFGVMGKLPGFEDQMATIRSYKIGCLLVAQSKKQLVKMYGEEEADIILELANTKMCMSRISGRDAQDFSDLAGVATVLTENQSGNRHALSVLPESAGRSRSETQRPLITPHELRTMGEEVLLVLADKDAVKVRQARYFKDRRLRRLASRHPDAVFRLVARPEVLADPGLDSYIPLPEQADPGERNGARTDEVTAPAHESTPAHAAHQLPAGADGGIPEARIGDDGAIVPGPRHESNGLLAFGTQERRVLRLMAAGHSNQQIAEEIGYPFLWVANCVQEIFKKLGVDDRGPALQVARQRGLLDHDEDREA